MAYPVSKIFIKIRLSLTCEKLSVQQNVEKPQVYMLARCPATDLQLAYVDTRLEDIKYVKFDFNFLDSTFLLKLTLVE